MQLAQSLLEPTDNSARALFARHGFAEMAELLYLHALVRKPPPVVDAIARGPAAAPAAVLARRLERCWEAELRVKSSGEPHAELTALVLDLCR